MKSDSSPEREHAHDYDIAKEVTGGNKKRKRKPYRPGEEGHDAAVTTGAVFLSACLPLFTPACLPLSLWLTGIGGFMVRQRGGKAAPSGKDSLELLPAGDGGETVVLPSPHLSCCESASPN